MRTDHLNNGGNHPFKHEEAITSKAYNPDGYFDTGYHMRIRATNLMEQIQIEKGKKMRTSKKKI